jgi:hypothetical protein
MSSHGDSEIVQEIVEPAVVPEVGLKANSLPYSARSRVACCQIDPRTDQETVEILRDDHLGSTGETGGVQPSDGLVKISDTASTSGSQMPPEAGDKVYRTNSSLQTLMQKKHMQAAAQEFVSKAAHGCPCHYIKEASGQRVKCRYYFGNKGTFMIITDNSSTVEVRCLMSEFLDWFAYMDDTDECFPMEVLELLEPEQWEFLIMVVYRDAQGKNRRFCFEVEDEKARDAFLESVQLLHQYVLNDV